MKKIINKQSNAKHCFVCGVDNAIGLHASFFETDEKEVVALFTPTLNHQGYPVRLHGGVAASILDEAIGRAIQIDAPDTWGVTAQLSLSYKKPLPCNAQLRAVGRITKQSRLLYEGSGEIYTPDGEKKYPSQGYPHVITHPHQRFLLFCHCHSAERRA